jgi:hypothetical protein
VNRQRMETIRQLFNSASPYWKEGKP